LLYFLNEKFTKYKKIRKFLFYENGK